MRNRGSLAYRLLLIGMLPVIAALLYIKGQRYDPALIDFKAAARQEIPNSGPVQSTREVASPAATEGIAGFRQAGKQKVYTKENLYEHVDGHAEYFIGAGFKALTVSEYISADSKATEAEIQVEVYDMGKSIQAFGVLADESGDNPAPVSLGTMGFRTSGGINFIKGPYYVKISALDPKASLLKFSKAFDKTLPFAGDSFQAFSRLPHIGKTINTRFIKEGYRGLDFLHNVIEREYSTGGGKVTVALITGNDKEIRSTMSSFHDYFMKSGIPNEKLDRDGKAVYRVMDKYEGNWFLIPSRDEIFGVFGTDDEKILGYFTTRKD
jgi:hypothetical protein